MVLVFNERLPRLGNLIIALGNAIQYGLYYRHNIRFPSHPFFKGTEIILFGEGGKEEILKSDFYFRRKDFEAFHPERDFPLPCFSENYEKTIQILREHFSVPKPESFPPDHLLIHIRSGDLFIRPHPDYICPPLAYYTKIIKENPHYTNIFLLSEDKLNPVIPWLLRAFPHIRLRLGRPLEEDVSFILKFPSIVMSFGTFIPCLSVFSDYLKHLYLPDYAFELAERIDSVFYKGKNELHLIPTGNYTQKMGKWQNSISQKRLMLAHRL